MNRRRITLITLLLLTFLMGCEKSINRPSVPDPATAPADSIDCPRDDKDD